MPKAAGTVSGPVNAVPCAHCGLPQDYTILERQRAEEGIDSELPTGASIECDECGKKSTIVGIRKMVIVRQT